VRNPEDLTESKISQTRLIGEDFEHRKLLTHMFQTIRN